MVAILAETQETSIFYPSEDGETIAESYAHIYALWVTLEVFRQYLEGRQATVLANQFLYYAQNYPKLRVTPDVMVIFDVAPSGRDNYKLWEEGHVPAVIFEMTSEGTENNDKEFKKRLYSQLGVQEYWLFDPKGEWVEEKLRGYRLKGNGYSQITDSQSEPLQLSLQVEGQLIAFYRQDTGKKLLIPGELAQAARQAEERAQQAQERAQQETLARQQAEERAQQETLVRQQAEERAQQETLARQQAQLQVEQLRERLRSLGIEPDAS